LALVGRAVPEKNNTVEHGERKTRFQHPRVVPSGHNRDAAAPNRNPNPNRNPLFWVATIRTPRRLKRSILFTPLLALILEGLLGFSRKGATMTAGNDKIGRNDPCPCGSGVYRGDLHAGFFGKTIDRIKAEARYRQGLGLDPREDGLILNRIRSLKGVK
jgi:hypothetical protein